MRMRKLGNTDLELTTVGLGTWAIGGPWQFGWGPQNDDDSLKAIFEAVDAGINWIDTAPAYGCGHSEIIVGKVLKQMKQKPIVATKCGLLWNERRERIPCLKRDSVLRECENSLKRLGVEAIDLYQMHWNQPAEDIEQAFEAMAQCAREGKVRYIGVSNFTAEQIETVQKIHPVASLQPPYSMLKREFEKNLLSFCKESNIGVIAYSPIQMGLLTGKFNAAKIAALPADDQRRAKPNFQEPQLTPTLELVEKLKPIADRNSKTLAQLAIAWVLRTEEVTSAIVGARKPGQITETAPAGNWQLDAGDIEEIEELLQQRQDKIKS